MRHHKEEKQEENKAEPEKEIEVAKMKPIADFLKDVNYEDIDSSLGIQLNQMLRKYTLRKTKLEQREKEVSTIYKSKIKYSRYYCNLIMDFLSSGKLYIMKNQIYLLIIHTMYSL